MEQTLNSIDYSFPDDAEIDKLRKERQFHYNKASEIQKQIGHAILSKLGVDKLKDKYIIKKDPITLNQEYWHVKEFCMNYSNIEIKGTSFNALYGDNGLEDFYYNKNSINILLMGELSSIKEITKEEYDNVLRRIVNDIKNE